MNKYEQSLKELNVVEEKLNGMISIIESKRSNILSEKNKIIRKNVENYNRLNGLKKIVENSNIEHKKTFLKEFGISSAFLGYIVLAITYFLYFACFDKYMSFGSCLIVLLLSTSFNAIKCRRNIKEIFFPGINISDAKEEISDLETSIVELLERKQELENEDDFPELKKYYEQLKFIKDKKEEVQKLYDVSKERVLKMSESEKLLNSFFEETNNVEMKRVKGSK